MADQPPASRSPPPTRDPAALWRRTCHLGCGVWLVTLLPVAYSMTRTFNLLASGEAEGVADRNAAAQVASDMSWLFWNGLIGAFGSCLFLIGLVGWIAVARAERSRHRHERATDQQRAVP